MQSFIPPLSPSKMRMLSPSRRDEDVSVMMEDDVIEIPDSAGLSDMTRDAIFNVWANDDPEDNIGFGNQVHYLRVTSFSSTLTTGLPINTIQTTQCKTQPYNSLPRQPTSRKGFSTLNLVNISRRRKLNAFNPSRRNSCTSKHN
jgi:hypothetical protein